MNARYLARVMLLVVTAAGVAPAVGEDAPAPKTGSVQGRLLFPGGVVPAKGAVIAILASTTAGDAPAEVVAGDDGRFALKELPPGKYLFDVRRPGEAQPWCTLEDVELWAGRNLDLGDVVLARNGWQYLFDGKSLDGWKESDFAGRSPVRVEKGAILLPMGNDMTGVTYKGKVPTIDYEVSLEARRVEGDDFFCALTFPVGKNPCTLVCGGWGGTVVGLSSLDGMDASLNETSRTFQFEKGRWYRIRLRVTRDRIQAWIDLEKMVDVATEGKQIGIRWEVEPSRPFGIATWRTTGALRDIRIRDLD